MLTFDNMEGRDKKNMSDCGVIDGMVYDRLIGEELIKLTPDR